MTSDDNVIPWPKPDPERSNDRGMVTILLDLSGSMNNELKDEDPSRDARITTRIAALEDGLQRLVSPDNSSSMHSAKSFDGSVEFALGWSTATTRTSRSFTKRSKPSHIAASQRLT